MWNCFIEKKLKHHVARLASTLSSAEHRGRVFSAIERKKNAGRFAWCKPPRHRYAQRTEIYSWWFLFLHLLQYVIQASYKPCTVTRESFNRLETRSSCRCVLALLKFYIVILFEKVLWLRYRERKGVWKRNVWYCAVRFLNFLSLGEKNLCLTFCLCSWKIVLWNFPVCFHHYNYYF